MKFKEELQALSENYKSKKLENFKKILLDTASKGERTVTIDEGLYDKWVVYWLDSENIDYVYGGHQKDGFFIIVSWEK